MALIHNSIGAGHNGVSQQPAIQRASGTVEEMINCIPTIATGTIKRNPIQEVETEGLSLTNGGYTYEYDRGYSSSNNSERFSIQLNTKEDGTEDNRIINLGTGELQTIKYSDEEQFLNDGSNNPQYIDPNDIEETRLRTDRKYMTSGIKQNYASVTLKDTTFITKKTEVPRVLELNQSSSGDIEEIRDYIEINFTTGITQSWQNLGFNSGDPYNWDNSKEAPYRHTESRLTILDGYLEDRIGYKYGYKTNVIVKNQTIEYTPPFLNKHTTNSSPEPDGMSMSEWVNNVYISLLTQISSDYRVSLYLGVIRIESLSSDNSLVASDISISMEVPIEPIIISPYVKIAFTLDSNAVDNFIDSVTEGTTTVNIDLIDQNYRKNGYIWFQKSEPDIGYSYTARIKVINVDEDSPSFGDITPLASREVTGVTTTEAVATAMALLIVSSTEIDSCNPVGSVLQIVVADGYEIYEVNMSDTFGDLASHGWGKLIDKLDNLPRSFPFAGAIVKVTGEDTDERNDYWVKRVGDVWQEWYDPFALRNIDISTMPRTIKDNNDGSFTVSKFEGWESMLVGDEVTNGIPSFLSTEDNPTPVIKDIFFHKNRLGFLTDRSIIFSEIGRFGNFWKTTVVAALDKDRIDGFVDSQSAIKLEYATSLEDLVVLFASSEQFLVSSPDVLSSKSIQVSKISAYDMNTEVRPIFANNSLYFCAIRGDYTQVMKYRLSELSGKTILATDMTRHVSRYIPKTVNSFSYSAINEMLFIVTDEDKDTIYVHKEVVQNNEVLQAAWFKWSFQLDVLKAFSFNNDLYMLTLVDSTHVNHDDWAVDSGVWDDTGFWYDEDIWNDDPSETVKDSKIQKLELFNNLSDDTVYLDNGTLPYTSLIELGEWKYMSGNVKEDRGHLLCKTIEIDSTDSEFQLFIRDVNRDEFRVVESKYTVNRKPMLYGNAKNIRVSIINNNAEGLGFKINNISLEGIFNIRSKRR